MGFVILLYLFFFFLGDFFPNKLIPINFLLTHTSLQSSLTHPLTHLCYVLNTVRNLSSSNIKIIVKKCVFLFSIESARFRCIIMSLKYNCAHDKKEIKSYIYSDLHRNQTRNEVGKGLKVLTFSNRKRTDFLGLWIKKTVTPFLFVTMIYLCAKTNMQKFRNFSSLPVCYFYSTLLLKFRNFVWIAFAVFQSCHAFT